MYDAVLESSIEGAHEVFARNIESEYKKWKSLEVKTGKTILEKQFEVNSLLATYSSFSSFCNYRC